MFTWRAVEDKCCHCFLTTPRVIPAKETKQQEPEISVKRGASGIKCWWEREREIRTAVPQAASRKQITPQTASYEESLIKRWFTKVCGRAGRLRVTVLPTGAGERVMLAGSSA